MQPVIIIANMQKKEKASVRRGFPGSGSMAGKSMEKARLKFFI